MPWILGRLTFEDTPTRAYQDISDDSPPTMSSMIGSFVSSLRPDRAFSSTPVNTPKELFKDQYVVPYFTCFNFLDAEEGEGLSRPVLFSCRYLSFSCTIDHFLQSSWKEQMTPQVIRTHGHHFPTRSCHCRLIC